MIYHRWDIRFANPTLQIYIRAVMYGRASARPQIFLKFNHSPNGIAHEYRQNRFDQWYAG